MSFGKSDLMSSVLMVFVLLFSCRLDGVKYENGKINIINKKTGNKPKFYQKKWCVFVCNSSGLNYYILYHQHSFLMLFYITWAALTFVMLLSNLKMVKSFPAIKVSCVPD